MRNCGSSAWNRLNNEQLSSLIVEVPVNGTVKDVFISAAENIITGASKDEKPKIFCNGIKALKSIEDISAACLNNMKQETQF